MAVLLIPHNRQLLDVMASVRAQLNAGANMRLFQNSFIPEPGDTLLDFNEANFPGYARWSLASQFGAPIKVRDGQYAIRSLEHTFTCTGASSSIVYGWIIVVNEQVYWSYLFSDPIPMGPAVSFIVKATLEDFALSIV